MSRLKVIDEIFWPIENPFDVMKVAGVHPIDFQMLLFLLMSEVVAV